MERLTKKAENGLAYLVKVKPDEQAVESSYPNTLKAILESFQCLAEYEDTGMTPEEIKKAQDALNPIPFGRFYEIMEAERDGRCVVLGDKVYGIISNYGYSRGEHVKMFTIGKTAFTAESEAEAALNKTEVSK